jgi:pimeloyl-ACP methyl ester carboxylesterase
VTARDPEPLPSPLHVERRGSGRDHLVLVHGFGASGHSWRKWVGDLERDHLIHLVDLMGFGRASTPPGGDYSPTAQARHLVELLRRLEGPPPVLVGHSLGAAVVMIATLRIQDEGGLVPLRGLVVVSGSVYRQRFPTFMRLAQFRPLGELFLLVPTPRWALRFGLRRIVHRRETVDAEQVEGYRDPLRSFARRRTILRAARQIRPDEAERFVLRYPEIRLPTLILQGEEDAVVPVALARRLEAALPHARKVLLPGVGHLLPEEAPEASVAALREFLAELPDTSPPAGASI